MEEGQRHIGKSTFNRRLIGLNPCCNGRGSKTQSSGDSQRRLSLNPCCNGRGSKTQQKSIIFEISVLILVVMEEGQRQQFLIAFPKYKES